ncbi:MAG: nitrite reductase, copper-containing [Methylococcales bacterium]|nr:nitrite reductase, copper-containing [Methylococcales bacterium]
MQTEQKNEVSVLFSQQHKSKLIIAGIITLFSSIYFLSKPDAKPEMNMSQGMDMSKGMSMSNFGPGDSHHIHKPVNPDDFKKVEDISKAATDLPAPLNRNTPKTVEINLTATEVVSDVAPLIPFHYWTFNDTVPGPFLRVRVGDTVKLTLHNDKTSSHSHAIDLHAVTGPGGGAPLTEVEPGETKTMQFKALTAGLFIYHCPAGNPPTHIAMGMYGMILVEPEGGLAPVDKEFYVMQGELYTKGMLGQRGYQDFDSMKMLNERPEYIFFNGRPWSLVEEGELKAKVGERVRIFMGNAGVSKISSFHVIGEIFDTVYPEAALSNPLKDVQTTLVPSGGATMVELQLDVPGNYALVDHALTRVDRGAWGILNVTGDEDKSIYSQVK